LDFLAVTEGGLYTWGVGTAQMNIKITCIVKDIAGKNERGG